MKNHFKLLRESEGLSQEKLAEILDIDKNTVQNCEYGKKPNKKTISAYKKYFGVSEDFLLNKTDSPNGTEILSQHTDDWIYLKSLEMSMQNKHLKFCIQGKYLNERYNDFADWELPDDFHPSIDCFLGSVFDLSIKKKSITYQVYRSENKIRCLHQCEALNIKLRYDTEPYDVIRIWTVKQFIEILNTIRTTSSSYLKGLLL